MESPARPGLTTSSEVTEAALAYMIGDQMEAAYRRDDLFEKRRLKARSGILLLVNQHR